MGVSFLRRGFRPTLAGSLAALVVVPLFVQLGFWQLHRSTEKRTLLARYARAATAESRPFSGVKMPASPMLRVRVSGVWNPRHSVLLDNRTRDGRPGVWVYSLLRIARPDYDGVLVNRGWLPVDLRTRRPRHIPPVSGPATLTGILTQPPVPAWNVGSTPVESDASIPLVTAIKLGELARRWRVRLWPGSIRVTDRDPNFTRAWEPHVMPPARHIAYAIQWFGMAFTVVVLYLLLGVRRARRNTGS